MIDSLPIRVASCVFAVLVIGYLYRRSSHWTHFRSAAVATAIAATFAVLVTVLSANGLGSYGFGLFMLVPMAAGFLAVLIHSLPHRLVRPDVFRLTLAVTAASGAALAGFAIEGFICLAMALPLAMPLVLIGGILAYGLVAVWIRMREPRLASGMLAVVMIGVPGAIEVEARLPRVAPTYEVTTTADIDAPPTAVWRATMEPFTIPKPAHAVFRAGIAYPMGAWVEGTGPGAVRHCQFSTGEFVEPIQVWDEPRLLRFSVISNPQPMQEWTLYGQIHPPHLDGFLVSRQGEFRLEPLPGGRTRLIATTWYQHNLYPAAYWRLWSDYILHRVHDVVLDNIAARAQAALRDASSK